MGRRKGQIAMMGNSLLVKDKQKRQGHRGNKDDSFLHTTDLDDGTTYNRINFQSVTEQSNLEDFLTTAEMAGKDFTAERQNIQIVTNPGQGKRLTEADLREISQAQTTHKALLQIPRRPHWDENTTKENLLLMERDSFTNWRRQLKQLEEKEHIQLTPYEKNLDFWRQLWRVIERSDVVVQIVDARNPLLFRCEDLETYVRQVDPRKSVMLLINKADFLTKHQRQLWVDYFDKINLRVVFFSALVEKENMENQISSTSLISSENQDKNIDSDEEEESEEDEKEFTDSDERKDDEEGTNSREESRNVLEDGLCEKFEESVSVPDDPERKENSDSNSNTSCLDSRDTDSSQSCQKTDGGQRHHTQDKLPVTEQSSCNSSTSKNHPDIVTADELLDVFRSMAEPSCPQNGDCSEQGRVKTVGMVGYPNVGKSSTINVILQQKKLAVSATPGKTKHFQTLFVDSGLMLCDCPGLVFPSFVATKAHLVINGILPIDELRDHVSPVNLICDRIPRTVLEATYSIMIPRPSMDDQADRLPTAEELLFAYGGMRGFMTPRGVPDAPRASRYILKDYVKGKLLYCEPPPGVDGRDFQDKDRVIKLEMGRPSSKKFQFYPGGNKQPPPQISSAIDKEFFEKRTGKAHSRGKLGVADHVRVDTLQPSARQMEASSPTPLGAVGGVADSHSSLASSASGVGKPWKKHNNRNKKEKLRRLHRDLDVN
ncbi:hypothetical protein RRG08_051102 [Elysia crispata]|uniref:Large subunit GTPase 1 homolog n=1 Tax=Elysia crispata TaxID=231223 RepID=A0AAE1AI21_9GAST|nr:hypothetical protein RRG08_051102 [Elysia crispata]